MIRPGPAERPSPVSSALTPVVGVSARSLFRIRASSWVRPGSSGAASGAFWVVGELDYRTRRELAWTASAKAEVVVVAADGKEIMSRTLEVKPSGLVGETLERQDDGSLPRETSASVGADAKWEVRSGLVLDATVNTDFAQVEADDQIVNLTRFETFFPEKRDFFLENAGIFEFGLPNRETLDPALMKVFFSRRIGLEAGREEPIDDGARLPGRAQDPRRRPSGARGG